MQTKGASDSIEWCKWRCKGTKYICNNKEITKKRDGREKIKIKYFKTQTSQSRRKKETDSLEKKKGLKKKLSDSIFKSKIF